MSLSTFKKKSVAIHGTNISGKGPLGFSLNGSIRPNRYIGKDCIRSSAGTPMNGQYPYGYGGIQGRYPTYISYNVYPDSNIGTHSLIPQKTVLTNRGMLHTRYKCIYNGTYPGNVVKNIYTGLVTDNSSQGIYIDKKTSDSACVKPIDKEGIRSSINSNGATDADTYLQYIKRKCVNKDTHLPKALNGMCR
jgi:hypothetical protein